MKTLKRKVFIVVLMWKQMFKKMFIKKELDDASVL